MDDLQAKIFDLSVLTPEQQAEINKIFANSHSTKKMSNQKVTQE